YKVKLSLVKSESFHCPLLALPKQPMNDFKPFQTYLEQVNIDKSGKIGLVGWKLVSNDFDDFHHNFDLPAFIVRACQDVFGKEKLVNATQVYMHPGKGARASNNANEIAHYEYGSSLASDAVLSAINELDEGLRETKDRHMINGDGHK